MSNGQHGGYRAPANPAPVSGPGKYSKRTDNGPVQAMSAAPGQAYGVAGQQMNSQRTAPLGAAEPLPKPAPVQGGGNEEAGEVRHDNEYAEGEFSRPTDNPDEPITAGASLGPGPGPEALMANQNPSAMGTGEMTALLSSLSPADTTGILAQLQDAARTLGV